MSSEPSSYLPYDEPDIVTILIQSSFLLALNIINHIFDNLIFCGLIGQIFIGVAWGTPGGKLLNSETEHVIVQLGYLGLILLVYEGGLQTEFSALKANALLSCAVAITGIVVPIGLSFSLLSLASATPLQAFAAGAALCSTSLGTTFTILSTSGLATTRLGVVLTSAAMMDDVVGLVMVQVISNLGGDDFSAVTVVRPIAVSIGLGVLVLLICRFVAKPVTLWCQSVLENKKDGMVRSCVSSVYAALIIHTAILLGLVTGATYAGTSNLFAAYLAGAAISWWDGEFTKPTPAASNTPNIQTTSSTHTQENISSTTIPANTTPSTPSLPPPTTTTPSQTSGTATFTRFYEPALHRILKPLFFASIGFAIPITKLFSGPIMWRGIIYTILMLISKLATGFWLLKFSVPIFSKLALKFRRKTLKNSKLKKSQKPITSNTGVQLQHIPSQPSQPTTASSSSPTPANTSLPRQPPKANTTPTKVPLSLYPAAMLGTAMTARGEIGFLIASLAETTGVFSSQTTTPVESSEIYLITTWAIVLCTIIGPLATGTLVKRVRRLEKELVAKGKSGREGPLGVWGLS